VCISLHGDPKIGDNFGNRTSTTESGNKSGAHSVVSYEYLWIRRTCEIANNRTRSRTNNEKSSWSCVAFPAKTTLFEHWIYSWSQTLALTLTLILLIISRFASFAGDFHIPRRTGTYILLDACHWVLFSSRSMDRARIRIRFCVAWLVVMRTYLYYFIRCCWTRPYFGRVCLCGCVCLIVSKQVRPDRRRRIQAGSAVEPAMAGDSRRNGFRLLSVAALLHGPQHRWSHCQQRR